ncbi:hypothetical protein [Aminobacter aminovorans]|uniref:hypothetical protein n=1 Tax=Aminobacter aminovorans TaxID=83263 RepID=UPI000E1FCC84|nr:hypothetical protein [Aminobacter aminovorans]
MASNSSWFSLKSEQGLLEQISPDRRRPTATSQFVFRLRRKLPSVIANCPLPDLIEKETQNA